MSVITPKLTTPIVTPKLTKRERQVIALASHGKKNREIAVALAVGEETIKSHVKNSLKKLGARDRTHAVAKCLRSGMIE